MEKEINAKIMTIDYLARQLANNSIAEVGNLLEFD
jgi:hypothetical protein